MAISFRGIGALGRLGNSLFQIASLTGIAKKLNTIAEFPNWKYSKYFKKQLKRNHKRFATIYEPQFNYSEHWLEDNKDYHGWLQSDKYFESKEKVKELFEFDVTFLELVRAKYRFDKETICISIRRGDFVGNPNYELIPIKFYIGALLKFDYEKYQLLFFSDDINYCKLHFGCLDNARFIQADPIEQLCLMTLCDNHIISNSTFSWWGAYLSESKRVIRPAYNFSEKYKLSNDEKDYWPQDWEVFDHKNYWIELEATFLIPIQYDHKDRLENMALVLNELNENFDTRILIGENKTTTQPNAERFDFDVFHRTKILNELAKKSLSDIIVIYDTDVIMPPMQLYLACKRIQEGSDVVYPYDGRFARVPRKYYPEVFKYDIGILSGKTFEGMREHDLKSVGGAVFFNKESFFKGGGENERFISYAPEDFERFERFTRLGFNVERIRGVLYHIDHFIGIDSYIHHKDYSNNENEYNKIKQMSEVELKKYYGYSSSL